MIIKNLMSLTSMSSMQRNETWRRILCFCGVVALVSHPSTSVYAGDILNKLQDKVGGNWGETRSLILSNNSLLRNEPVGPKSEPFLEWLLLRLKQVTDSETEGAASVERARLSVESIPEYLGPIKWVMQYVIHRQRCAHVECKVDSRAYAYDFTYAAIGNGVDITHNGHLGGSYLNTLLDYGDGYLLARILHTAELNQIPLPDPLFVKGTILEILRKPTKFRVHPWPYVLTILVGRGGPNRTALNLRYIPTEDGLTPSPVILFQGSEWFKTQEIFTQTTEMAEVLLRAGANLNDPGPGRAPYNKSARQLLLDAAQEQASLQDSTALQIRNSLQHLDDYAETIQTDPPNDRDEASADSH